MVDRREFLDTAVALGVTVLSGGAEHASAAAADYAPTALTAVEMTTLKAMMARLLPADAQSGGAVEACAYIYVDQALSHSLSQHLPAYQAGLSALEAIASARYGAAFAALAGSDQDGLLSQLEVGTLGDPFEDGGRTLFGLVRRHTLEGTFCDPMYGGNRDFIGWRLIGFQGVQYFYSVDAQTIDGEQQSTPRSIADYGGQPDL